MKKRGRSDFFYAFPSFPCIFVRLPSCDGKKNEAWWGWFIAKLLYNYAALCKKQILPKKTSWSIKIKALFYPVFLPLGQRPHFMQFWHKTSEKSAREENSPSFFRPKSYFFTAFLLFLTAFLLFWQLFYFFVTAFHLFYCFSTFFHCFFYFFFHCFSTFFHCCSAPALWSFLHQPICKRRFYVWPKMITCEFNPDPLLIPEIRSWKGKKALSGLTWEALKFAGENNFA